MSTAARLRSASSDEQFIKIPERTTIGVLPARVAGKPVETGDTAVVRSPYDDSAVAVVHRAGPDEIERAIAAATEAFETTRKLASHERAAVLERISGLIAERRDDLARTIALEAGKPLKTARVEAE